MTDAHEQQGFEPEPEDSLAPTEEAVDDDLPSEVAADIDSELEALEKAAAAEDQGTSFEPSAPIEPADLSLFDPSFGMGGGFAAEAPAQRPRSEEAVGVHRSIEELCSANPRLQNGEAWLAVKRTHPKSFHGQPCTGWIEDVFQPLTTADLKERYGGGTLEITVMGTQPSDPSKHRAFGRVIVAISGAPKVEEKQDTMNRGYSGGSEKTETLRVQAEIQERARLQQQIASLQTELRKAAENGARGNLSLAEMEKIARERADDVRSAGLESMSIVKSENHKLQQKIDALEKEMKDMREARELQVSALKEENLRLKTESSQARQIEETTRIRELKDEHRNQLADLKERLEERFRQEKDAHERELRQNRERFDEERRSLTDTINNERRDRRDDQDRAVAALRADNDRTVASIKESYKERFQDLERANKNELSALKTMFEAQLQAIRSAEEAKAQSTGAVGSMQVMLLTKQLDEARTNEAQAKAEAAELRMKVNRTPLEALDEARHLITAIGGNVTMGGGGGEGEEQLSWQNVAMRALQTVAEKGAEVFESVQAGRDQNRAAAEAQAHAQAQAQAMAQHQQAMALRQIPAPAAQTPQRRPFRPQNFQPHVPDSMSAVPLSSRATAPPNASAAPIRGVRGEEESIPMERPQPSSAFSVDNWLSGGGAPSVFGDDDQGSMPPAAESIYQEPAPAQHGPEQHEAAHQPEQQSDEQQLQQQPAPPPPQGGELIPGLPNEKVGKFLMRLDGAVESIVSEKLFAKEFVAQVGEDTARTVVTQYTADQVVALAKAHAPPGMASRPLFKFSGKVYARNVWREVQALVGAPAP